MTGERDFWACKVCRSINTARASRCYSCHTPREAGGVKPSELPTLGSAGPITVVGQYRSSELWAVLMTLAAVVFVGITAVSLFVLLQAGELFASGERSEATSLLSDRLPFYVAAAGATITALLLYGMWMRQVVANLPHVGLGYARVSPDMAFVEPLVPGFNLYTIPARMADILQKLEAKGPGLPMIVIAWFLVIAPPVVVYVSSRVASWLESGGEAVRTLAIVLLAGFGVQVVGLVIGLFVAWRIERLMRERASKASPGPGPELAPRTDQPRTDQPRTDQGSMDGPESDAPAADRATGIEGIGRRL